MKGLKIANIKHPVIVFENGLGDQILTLPTLRALYTMFNDSMVLVCGDHDMSSFFFNEIKFKKIIRTTFVDISDGVRNFNADNVHVQIGQCDLLINLCPWQSESGQGIQKLCYLLANVPSIGFSELFKYSIPLFYYHHISDLIFEIVKLLCDKYQIDDYVMPIKFKEKIQTKDYQYLIKKSTQNKILTVQIETKEFKMWDLNCFNQLFDKIICNNPNFSIVIVGSNSPKIELYPFKNNENISFYDTDENHMELSCAIVAQSDYFIGIDSLFLHVADLYKIPSIGIFGPSSYTKYGCRFAKHVHVGHERRNMNFITVDAVYDAFKKLMS